jgi:hypothetical protein
MSTRRKSTTTETKKRKNTSPASKKGKKAKVEAEKVEEIVEDINEEEINEDIEVANAGVQTGEPNSEEFESHYKSNEQAEENDESQAPEEIPLEEFKPPEMEPIEGDFDNDEALEEIEIGADRELYPEEKEENDEDEKNRTDSNESKAPRHTNNGKTALSQGNSDAAASGQATTGENKEPQRVQPRLNLKESLRIAMEEKNMEEIEKFTKILLMQQDQMRLKATRLQRQNEDLVRQISTQHVAYNRDRMQRDMILQQLGRERDELRIMVGRLQQGGGPPPQPRGVNSGPGSRAPTPNPSPRSVPTLPNAQRGYPGPSPQQSPQSRGPPPMTHGMPRPMPQSYSGHYAQGPQGYYPSQGGGGGGGGFRR